MALTFQIIGQRLKDARNFLGVSQKVAAGALGVSRSAISEIETGKRAIKGHELAELAKLYHRPVGFFLAEEPAAQEEPFAVLMRAKDVDSRVKSAILDFEKMCKNYMKLEEVLDMRLQTKLCSYPPSNPQRIAIQERDRLGLGRAPLRDIASFLEKEIGVKTFYVKCKNAKFAGACTYQPTFGACILVNLNHPRGKRSYTVAHEYYHLLTRQEELVNEVCFEPSDHEDRKAERFAAEFLMPGESVRERVRNIVGRIHLTDIVHLSEYFGVSNEALLYRLENLGFLARGQAAAIVKDRQIKFTEVRKNLGYTTEEPPIINFPERYVVMAFRAYHEAKVDLGKLAELLEMPLSKIRAIVDEIEKQEKKFSKR